MIKLFWCPQTRAARALWMMEELGVEYELVKTDIRAEEDPNRAELLTASPMGKVPALIDGDVFMSETAAMCIYLADRYTDAGLAPKVDAAERGQYLYWMFYVPGVVEPAMTEKFSGAEANKFRNGWGDFTSMIETLEKGLGDKEWMLASGFSAADVMLGSTCSFMKQFGMLPDSEALNAYVERCSARVARRRADEIEADHTQT
ncbi:MAG: glutathione S-transferase [Kordiimonadales bacterium]|nr:MAG: glutathione S-transferase [Kordiimonadales bacterium]